MEGKETMEGKRQIPSQPADVSVGKKGTVKWHIFKYLMDGSRKTRADIVAHIQKQKDFKDATIISELLLMGRNQLVTVEDQYFKLSVLGNSIASQDSTDKLPSKASNSGRQTSVGGYSRSKKRRTPVRGSSTGGANADSSGTEMMRAIEVHGIDDLLGKGHSAVPVSSRSEVPSHNQPNEVKMI